ncbi:unnamed protein product [Brassica napus]|uniref:(rape) hypothetical protein n=1 Tax=Brassica napus TaxID=3708 RepID=A0A816J898_BRANA|nr:unnamed protein product [Brassica napus]
MFMVLALVSALVFLQSQAGNYCPLENINSIPGCFDALKLATGKDISKLTRACCRAVFSVSSDTCYLLLFPGKAYPIKIFRDICLNVNYHIRCWLSKQSISSSSSLLSLQRYTLYIKRNNFGHASMQAYSYFRFSSTISNSNRNKIEKIKVIIIFFVFVLNDETKANQRDIYGVSPIVSALVFLQSEAGNYCPTENINSIPGCFDALKLASGKDYRRLTRDCCRAVFSVIPDTCFLLLFPGKAYPIKMFRNIRLNVNYVSAASPF